MAVGAAAATAAPHRPRAAAPVALARCASYGAAVLPVLQKMFDQLGGLGRLVKGKTVAVKLNLTGTPFERHGYLDAGLAHWTHQDVTGATVHLLGRAAPAASACSKVRGKAPSRSRNTCWAPGGSRGTW